jgi:hypothetical protein
MGIVIPFRRRSGAPDEDQEGCACGHRPGKISVLAEPHVKLVEFYMRGVCATCGTGFLWRHTEKPDWP